MNASPSSSIGASRRAAPVAEPLRRHVASLLAECKPGFALPGAFFTDEALYAAELEYIFGRHWLFVASEPEIPEGGDYRTFQIGPWPIFIVRRDDGSIGAFHNTCRHRGSRILLQASGIAGATLQCPYHRWTYDLDGRVIGCGATGEAAAAQRRLKAVHVRQLAGLVFICLADEPPGEIDEPSLSAPERAAYARYQGARQETEAIWRRQGLPWQCIEELHGRPTAFRTERLVLDGAGESMTPDTRVASRRLLGDLSDARLGTLHYHTQPNAWFHFLSDHVLTFATLSLERGRTLVRSTWLVHADAQEGRDYDLEKLTSVWNATNAQDAAFVAETQRGASSPAYEPGPIAASEYMVKLFHVWYEERLRAEMRL